MILKIAHRVVRSACSPALSDDHQAIRIPAKKRLFVDLVAGEAQICHSEGGAALNPDLILHSGAD
jgi:hypothetical protein